MRAFTGMVLAAGLLAGTAGPLLAQCTPTVAFVTDAGQGRLLAVDLATGASVPVAFGLNVPMGVDLDPTESIAYVADWQGGRLLAIDLTTHAVKTVASGLSNPADVDVNAAGTIAYVVQQTSGTLSAVSLSSGAVSTVATGLSGPAGVALNTRETFAFVTENGGGVLSAINLGTGSRVVEASGLGHPLGVANDPLNNGIYFTKGDLSMYDFRIFMTRLITANLTAPEGVAVDGSGLTAYVAERGSGELSSVNLQTGAVTLVAPGLGSPSGVALACHPTYAPLVFRGRVERAAASTCLEGTHLLSDPCTGSSVLLSSTRFNLDSYLCSDVVVSGPDIGVECPDIDVQSIDPSPPSCTIMVRELLVLGGADAQMQWTRVPCAFSYDAIRGNVAGLAQAPTGIDLGQVTCLGNDLPASDLPIYDGPHDPETPSPGQAFFYLARVNGSPFLVSPYGFSSDNLEELPSSGDCPR